MAVTAWSLPYYHEFTEHSFQSNQKDASKPRHNSDLQHSIYFLRMIFRELPLQWAVSESNPWLEFDIEPGFRRIGTYSGCSLKWTVSFLCKWSLTPTSGIWLIWKWEWLAELNPVNKRDGRRTQSASATCDFSGILLQVRAFICISYQLRHGRRYPMSYKQKPLAPLSYLCQAKWETLKYGIFVFRLLLRMGYKTRLTGYHTHKETLRCYSCRRSQDIIE